MVSGLESSESDLMSWTQEAAVCVGHGCTTLAAVVWLVSRARKPKFSFTIFLRWIFHYMLAADMLVLELPVNFTLISKLAARLWTECAAIAHLVKQVTRVLKARIPTAGSGTDCLMYVIPPSLPTTTLLSVHECYLSYSIKCRNNRRKRTGLLHSMHHCLHLCCRLFCSKWFRAPKHQKSFNLLYVSPSEFNTRVAGLQIFSRHLSSRETRRCKCKNTLSLFSNAVTFKGSYCNFNVWIARLWWTAILQLLPLRYLI